MSEERIAAADGSAVVANGPAGPVGPGGPAGPAGPAGAVNGDVPGLNPGSPGQPTAPVPGAPSQQPGVNNPATVPSANPKPGAKSGPNPGTGGAAPAQTGSAPCTQQLTPLVLGQTAPISGVIGATHANLRSGLALWLRAVNARGGVQCHPVQLYQMDDAADPARVVSNLTELVKNKKAQAIVGIGIPTTLPAARKFAEQNKVPFVGGDLTEPAWFASPWMFPQGGTPLAEYAGAVQEAAASIGAKKVGLVYCVEASICGTINENFDAMAKASGLEVVLRKVSSITAPDYTAECQALKSAGAEVVFYGLDGSGAGRMARSCRAIGYETPVAAAALAVSGPASEDQYLQAQGVFLGTAAAPFAATDTPGAKAFQAAYQAYAPGSPVDQNSMSAWASGKLLEAALATVAAEARSGPISTELILEGLGNLKNEKLDGLSPGITFTRGGLPKAADCYYTLTITTKGYQAPKGSKLTCIAGLPRGF
jgi:branched-chain amino acid transport system substrate-binding protein